MVFLRQSLVLSTLLLSALASPTPQGQQDQQDQPGQQQQSAQPPLTGHRSFESFQRLLADVEESSIHSALHVWSSKFQDGVFSRDRTALEAVHSENAPLATSLLHLAKRQEANTTVSVTPSTTTPAPESDSPSPSASSPAEEDSQSAEPDPPSPSTSSPAEEDQQSEEPDPTPAATSSPTEEDPQSEESNPTPPATSSPAEEDPQSEESNPTPPATSSSAEEDPQSEESDPTPPSTSSPAEEDTESEVQSPAPPPSTRDGVVQPASTRTTATRAPSTAAVPVSTPPSATPVATASGRVVFSVPSLPDSPDSPESTGRLTTIDASSEVINFEPSSSTVLSTFTMPDGSISTQTSVTVVDAPVTGGGVRSPAPTPTDGQSDPQLQSAASATRSYWKEVVAVVGGAVVMGLAM